MEQLKDDFRILNTFFAPLRQIGNLSTGEVPMMPFMSGVFTTIAFYKMMAVCYCYQLFIFWGLTSFQFFTREHILREKPPGLGYLSSNLRLQCAV